MLAILRFWFDRGVDGFSVDAIHHLFEDEQLRDNPPNLIGARACRAGVIGVTRGPARGARREAWRVEMNTDR